jgi:hypothetical protein
VIVNLTPHEITVLGPGCEIVKRIPPSGSVARLESWTVPRGEDGGVPITFTEFGSPEGLPDPKEGVWLVVSQLVKSRLPGRADLLVPSEVVKDRLGRVLGCRSLGA